MNLAQMTIALAPWDESLKHTMATRSIEDGHSTSSSPDLDWENKDAGVDSSFDSQVSLWTNEGLSLVDCVCGAPPESYCTCLPISMALSTDGDNDDYHHWQTWYSNSHSNSHSNISITETTTPTSSSLSPDTASAVPVTSVVRSSNRTKETEAPTRPQLTTRKERRRQQNRAAQVRHRNKRNRFLHDTLHKIEALNNELKLARAQKEYFRLLYEGLETQMLEIRRQALSP